MKKRQCVECNNILPPHSIGRRCYNCQAAALEYTTGTSPDHYNVRDMMAILGLTSEEQVRRLSREGKIPGRVPIIQQHLFSRETINEWIRRYQVIPKEPTSPLQEEAKKRCKNQDHDWLFDKRFNGIAYSSEDEVIQHRDDKWANTGHKRTCYFCGYSTFVASLYNY